MNVNGRSVKKMMLIQLITLSTLGLSSYSVNAAEINIYSSRHYDSDEALYSAFEEQTGIKVNRVEDNASVLLQRLKSEGELSPADIFMTVDAGRLHKADKDGLFQAVKSETLESKIPPHLRHPEGHWFGFSKRARVIFYDTSRIDPKSIQSYEDLAKSELKGLICTRSSSNIYMLSLMAAMIEHLGEEGAKNWAKGLWDNRARDPEGGDTDQLRGIVSGQCGVVLANTYYFARALRTNVKGLSYPEQTSKIGVIFPDQDGKGAHINISGAGLLKNAPNKENAIKFLEFLASYEAQKHFAESNDEYPVVEGVELPETVAKLGDFEEDHLNLKVLGDNQALAQAIYDEIGYK